ncbi:MAG TPA: amidase [Burkholderiales bacterium]|nr:amidase [Burkholderiales bacterium]
MTDRLNELSASEAARRIARRELTSEALVRACLERVEAREETVRAWAFIDPGLALAEARARDREAPRGPLHGVPIGVKDVLDTADMPTQMGSPIYAGWRPRADAACVAIARAAGAVVLGKTVTAELAGMAPGATRNPRDPTRTPGGSSSGSAAAVADFMVPLALGTQTGGSVLRPASFCGVVGFKPSFGRYNRSGLKMAAESLDTIGTIARTLDDIELLDAALTRAPVRPARARASHGFSSAPRIGVCRTPMWQTALPETMDAVEDAAARLSRSGASVRDVPLPEPFAGLAGERDVLGSVERSRAIAHEWRHHRDALSERMRRAVELGLGTSEDDYRALLALAADCRAKLAALFRDFDMMLTPCVPGEAPAGLESTGDPRFQRLWTALHVPAIALPTHQGPAGLPVAIQLVGRAGGDLGLLESARWVWDKLGGSE